MSPITRIHHEASRKQTGCHSPKDFKKEVKDSLLKRKTNERNSWKVYRYEVTWNTSSYIIVPVKASWEIRTYILDISSHVQLHWKGTNCALRTRKQKPSTHSTTKSNQPPGTTHIYNEHWHSCNIDCSIQLVSCIAKIAN